MSANSLTHRPLSMLASSSKNAVTKSLRSFLRAEPQCRRAGPSCSRWASTIQASKTSYVYEHERPESQASEGREKKQTTDRFRIVRGVHLSECNLQMRECLNKGQSHRVISIAAFMKSHGIQPDLETYLNILTALAKERNHSAALATMKDMQAVGINPDISCLNQILQASRGSDSEKFNTVLSDIVELDLQLNKQTYEIIIEYYAAGDNIEMALSKLAEMQELGLTPSLASVKSVVESLANTGHVQLAFDVVDAYVEKSGRRLPGETWVQLLGASAETLNGEGVLKTWEKVVNEHHIVPDEGLCEKVLETCGRHALPTLASQVFQQLEVLGVQYQDYHFVPMIDAFVRKNQLKSAFEAVTLMLQSGVTPTVDSLFTVREAIQRDPEAIDNAFAIVEDMQKAGEKIDICVVNTLISSCNWSKDLQRAVGIYKAMPDLGMSPNVDTYEAILLVCRNTTQVDVAERLFSSMREAGLKPSAKCYDLLIITILKQDDYENAFFFLETMKEEGHKPAATVYEHIVKKCVKMGDGRYKLALDEMRQMGYRVSVGLRTFVESGGTRWTGKEGHDNDE